MEPIVVPRGLGRGERRGVGGGLRGTVGEWGGWGRGRGGRLGGGGEWGLGVGAE